MRRLLVLVALAACHSTSTVGAGTDAMVPDVAAVESAPEAPTVPIVTIGALSVSGRLEPDVIARRIHEQLAKFRLCYERARSTKPALEGSGVLRFIIDVSGKASAGAPTAFNDAGDDPFPDPDVKACMLDVITKTSFPQPTGGIVRVFVPVTLTSGSIDLSGLHEASSDPHPPPRLGDLPRDAGKDARSP